MTRFEESVNGVCEEFFGFPYEVIDEVVDEQFYTEFESALEQTLNKFAKRKYESRGSPPKDVLRCMYCNGAYWHLADGWGTAETLCGDPFVCRDCLYKESKK